MYQVVDGKTGKVLSEHLTFRAAEIDRNRHCLLPADFMRYVVIFWDPKDDEEDK